MKRFLLATAAVVMFAMPVAAQAAETYHFDPNHTNINWNANHFGFSSPSGRFGLKDGSITLDDKTPANSSVNVTIDVNGLVTGIPKFDEHLKSPDFLDTAKFPEATFKSTKVETGSDNTAKVTGDLTLHGVTKPVVLDVKLNKQGENPMTKVKSVGFSGKTVIKRSEFGIDKYVPNVSDEVTIAIEAEAGLK